MWVKLSVHRVVYLTLVILSVFLIFTDNALYPVLFSEYVCSVAPCPTGARVGLRLLMLAATFILNLLGIEIVGISSVIITAVTVFPFVAMFVIHLFSTGFYINWASLATIPSNVQWSAFIATASWNLSGLEQAGAVAEDVRQPQHSILRALLALLGLALVTYIPPVLTGVSTTDGPLRLEEWETGFWTQVAHGVGGNGLQMIMTLSSVVSAFGLTLSALCTTSHIIAGMALTEAIPNPLRDYLARRHPRFQTHHYTITLNVALTAVFSTCLDFGPLVMLDQVLYGIRVVFIFLAFFACENFTHT
ncbi:amino acid permease/transporter [Angomonas deanei]|uniref:Amino acid permease, putative n=1 Tax=Angomonas deanei TaxID=59799 RepID=A0A7G2CU47_9TRYP|nr:amino acid permease/transporter [Angomonas deanei]CAD2222809.1 Amino acid permease, putative [Angomonas deanei]|eukprot:EPY30590.1 amino acid permease/transporter [Angomonas deanei]